MMTKSFRKVLYLALTFLQQFLASATYESELSVEIYAEEISINIKKIYTSDILSPHPSQRCMTLHFAWRKQSLPRFQPPSQEYNIPVIISRNSENVTQQSFFGREYTVDDVIKSTSYGILRHTVNCISEFLITRAESEDELKTVANEVLWRKLARPSTDFFFLVGPKSEIRAFSESRFGHDVRFKYAVVIQANMSSYLFSYCAIVPEQLDLFNRRCYSVLNGQHFIATSVMHIAKFRYENNPDGSRKWGAGVYFSLLNEASCRYNFTFGVGYANFGGAAGFVKNGSWFGAVGEVFKREADLAFGTGITVHRYSVVDPSVTLSYFSRAFFVSAPRVSTSWKSVYRPLAPSVWFSLMLTLLLALPAYCISAKAYAKFNSQHQRSKSSLVTVFDALLEVLLEQGTSISAWKGLRMLFLFILWAFVCIILQTGYRCKLVSFLTTLEKEPVPRTHNELSLSSHTIYFRYYGGIPYRHMVESNDEMHKRFLQKIILVNSSIECVVLAIMTDYSACMDFKPTSEFVIATNATLHANARNEILVPSEDVDVVLNLVWSFRKGSPLVESFNTVILRSLASGLTDHWLKMDGDAKKLAGAKWTKSLQTSALKDKIVSLLTFQSVKPLFLTDLTGSFALFIFGVVVSLVGIFAETTVSRFGAWYLVITGQTWIIQR